MLKIDFALRNYIIHSFAYGSMEYERDADNYEYGISVEDWACSPIHDADGFVQRLWTSFSLKKRSEIIKDCIESLERQIAEAKNSLKNLSADFKELSELVAMES